MGSATNQARLLQMWAVYPQGKLSGFALEDNRCGRLVSQIAEVLEQQLARSDPTRKGFEQQSSAARDDRMSSIFR